MAISSYCRSEIGKYLINGLSVRNLCKYRVLGFVHIVVFTLSLCACATSSDSKPLDYAHKAANEEDVLNYCGSLTEKDQALALTTGCMEIAIHRFENLRSNEGLVNLFRVFNEKKERSQKDQVQNISVWAAYHLARGGEQVVHACQNEPFEAAVKEFPSLKKIFYDRCKKVLAEHNSSSTVLPAELQGLTDDLRAAYGPSSVPMGGKVKLSSKVLSYCRAYRPYVYKIMAVKDLIDYRNVVQNNGGSGNSVLLAIIEQRVTTLLSEIVDVKPTLERTYAELGRSFNRADCYFSVDSVESGKKIRRRRSVKSRKK